MTINAGGEAEATCAALDKAGLVDGCVTSDVDVFLFGGQMVYKRLSLSVRSLSVWRQGDTLAFADD